MNFRIIIIIAVIYCFIMGYIAYSLNNKLLNLNPTTFKMDSSRVMSQSQRIYELEEAVRLGLIEKTHLIDKIAQQTKIKAKTIIVEKKIPIVTEKIIIIDKNSMDTHNFVRVPFNVIKIDSFFYLKGHVDTSYFTLDTLSVNNALSIVVGEHKGKWWQKSKPLVEVKSSNPFTHIEMENVTIKQNKKFWQKPLFGFLIGAIGMMLIL